jgi:hypothetical protein
MVIKFNVDIKTIRKAFALMELDVPSDAEIESKMSNAVVDLSDSDDTDIKQAELAFTLMAIGKTFE